MLLKNFTKYLLTTFFIIASTLLPGINWPGGQALSPGALIGSHAQAHENDTKARRIVSMAPNITETIFALGCGERLIAVTDFCKYPPEAKELPSVGGYFNPNMPDLVIVQGKHEKMERFCRQKGIPILHVRMDSLSSIYNGILELGRVLDCTERAQKLCAAIRGELEQIREKTAGRSRKKVFVCLGRSPGSMASLYTAGGPSFVSEILQIAGGENIFSDVTQPYPEASKESLIKRAPEIIIETRPGENITDVRRRRIISEWNVLRGIPAVSNRRVYVLAEDFLLVPGPRVGAAARCLARTLHGE
ncbi:MAG: ABC transporter substrate-binding protein [Deltaproteobacteria bacterium]|nr:ABC transporter substrate-binding protein [Deltaproteobacteria bacterium]